MYIKLTTSIHFFAAIETPTPKQPVMMPDVLEEKPDMNHNVIANGTSPADDLTEDMIKRNLENLRNRKNKANAPAVKGKENGWDYLL